MVPLLAFIFGAFIGSFLNVCIHRLPRNESVVHPPSRCYSCGTRVQWYDNLPVVSYLLLRGRCRWCGADFSLRYLMMEVVSGLLCAGVATWAFAPGAGYAPSPWLTWALYTGTSYPHALLDLWVHGAAAAVVLALAFYLLVSAVIDLEHWVIPDELTKSFQLAAPLLAVLAGANLGYGEPIGLSWLRNDGSAGPEVALGLTPGRFLIYVLSIGSGALLFLLLSLIPARRINQRFASADHPWSEDDHRGQRIGVLWFCASTAFALAAFALLLWLRPGDWLRLGAWGPVLALQGAQAIFGSLAGWLSLYLVGLVGSVVFRKEAMGFGDVKFLAPIGAFLGPVGVLYTFFAAAIIGTLVNLPIRLLGGNRELPFGPYLAAGALLVLAAGQQFHHWLFGPLLHA